MSLVRTDLAMESREIAQSAGALQGVVSEEEKNGDVIVTRIKVLDERGVNAIGKPVGTYVTIETPGLSEVDDVIFFSALDAVSRELQKMLEPIGEGEVLVAGLGNASMTPDSIGPRCIKNILVTRHITGGSSDFHGFDKLRQVAAVAPGVLGQTGVESGEFLKALVMKMNPVAVVVVDALASRKASRLGCTVQMADTGIIPGSGVGNSRFAVNSQTLGVPVISVGVPTIVDAATLAFDLLEGAGLQTDETVKNKLGACVGENAMFVTPRFIDAIVEHASRLTGLAINKALNPSVSLEDMTALIS